MFKFSPDGELTEDNVLRDLGQDLIDGNNHDIAINIQPVGATVVVDSFSCGLQCIGAIPSADVTFDGPLTFGGGVDASSALSSLTESSTSFIGCMETVIVNGDPLSYSDILSRQEVALGCNRTECLADSCLNGGLCRDLWFTTMCDCPFGFSGPRCGLLNLAHCPGDSFVVFSDFSQSVSLEWSTAAEQGTIATLVQVGCS